MCPSFTLISREDYFQFGGTVKAYFCNNPIKIKKWEPGLDEDLRRVKRTASSRSGQNENYLKQKNEFKRIPNDDRFYQPKTQTNKNKTEVSAHKGK